MPELNSIEKCGNQIEINNDQRKINKASPFIVANIFFERYCTAGILAILPLFLHLKLGLSTNMSTSMYHIYEGCTLLCTIIGAVLADVWLGLYKSILIMSLVYMSGLIIVAIGLIPPLNVPFEIFILTGLLITIIGCGAVKGIINVFGGSQHTLPEQSRQLEIYFSAQYFALKCGSFLARFTFPILKEDIKCFGDDDCYLMPFGVALISLTIALLVFLCGHFFYRHVPSNGNMLLRVFNCITCALKERSKHKKPDQHWLSYAEEKFGRKLVLETKVALKVLVIFIPIPMYWCLYMQQSSRFIFQATRMNGDLGFYTIKKDQMLVINSFLVIILIPFFERFGFKIFAKFGIKTMLHRMIFGTLCTVVAFILAGLLEMQVNQHEHQISMLWQLPQFFVFAVSEVFVYISHLNFAYNEAPASMKPVMISFMFFTIALGDFIVAIISGVSFFKSQVVEYFFFASIMALDVALLAFLAKRYKHTDHEMIKLLNEDEKS